MHSSTLVLGLAASLTAAMPASNPHHKMSALELCEAADNCEIYEDNGHKKIRFIAGKEPGSADYESKHKLMKRDDAVTTKIYFGDNTDAWGCTNDPGNLLGHLGDVCPQGVCITNEPWTLGIDYVTPLPDDVTAAGPKQRQLDISARGEFPVEWRNAFIEATQTMASGKVIWKDQLWAKNGAKKREVDGALDRRDTGPQDNPGNEADAMGTCHMAIAPTFYSVQRWATANGGAPALSGFMDTTITLESPTSGFCAANAAWIAGGAAAGLIPGIGAGVAAIFGSVIAACAAAAVV